MIQKKTIFYKFWTSTIGNLAKSLKLQSQQNCYKWSKFQKDEISIKQIKEQLKVSHRNDHWTLHPP